MSECEHSMPPIILHVHGCMYIHLEEVFIIAMKYIYT